MTRTVLVTGGAGTLGRRVVRRLEARGYTPRVMSRGARPGDLPATREWARAELASGEGVPEAVEGVDAVVHSASSVLHHRDVDVAGTRDHLLPAAGREGVRHLVFPSIVGIDEVAYSYYDSKLAVEEMLLDSGVPVTVARATQFHSLVHPVVKAAGVLPVMPLPTEFRLQTVYAGDFAAYVVELLEDGPGDRAPDFAGPEVRTLGDMARAWADVRGRTRWTLRLPIPGELARAFREGKTTNPERAEGTLGWEEWLRRRAAA